MKIGVIAFTKAGGQLGKEIQQGLGDGATLHVPQRWATEVDGTPYTTLDQWTKEMWHSGDALIFIGATGIGVRAIAPYVKDKFTDPAVLAVDELGRYTVPLLSGHVGGGNKLAVTVAKILGGTPVISTATDLQGVFAVDVWAKEQGLVLHHRTLAKEISATLLEGGQVGFASDFGHPCPQGLTQEQVPLGIWVTDTGGTPPFLRTLSLSHRGFTLGIGCRRGVSQETIAQVVTQALGEYPLSGVTQVATIDIKGQEVGLLDFCQRHQLPLVTFSAQELAQAEGEFTPSAFVAQTVGVDNVCERAATLAGGELMIKKFPKDGVTVALAWNK